MVATGLRFPRPIPTREKFMDTWKELATRAPVVVGPNSPLGFSSMVYGLHTRVLLGGRDGPVRGQGHGRNSNDMGRELASLWPIRCSLIFALISPH